MFEICGVENCKNEPYYGVGGHVSQFCSEHEDNHYECKESNCLAFIFYEGFCSQHAKFCSLCRNEIGEKYKSYCSGCSRKCKFCGVEIHKGEGDYCLDHKAECCYGRENCSQRVSKSWEYCYGHKKECEFEDCNARIADIDYLPHCSSHPREKQIEEYKRNRNNEKNRANDLQTQLNTTQTQLTNANTKITRAQTSLGINNLDDLATELQNSAGDI